MKIKGNYLAIKSDKVIIDLKFCRLSNFAFASFTEQQTSKADIATAHFVFVRQYEFEEVRPGRTRRVLMGLRGQQLRNLKWTE